jgi:D-proline reductase (dithiol) PrdB
MPFQYLPVMAQNSAPKPPRLLVKPSKPAWCPVTKRLNQSRVAMLTSAALRLKSQEPFIPREDFGYRHVPSDPGAGEITIDHHSGIGRVPKQDPEIVFPRTALAELQKRGVIGSLATSHYSCMGGLRDHGKIEKELAMAIARDMKTDNVDLALLVPY